MMRKPVKNRLELWAVRILERWVQSLSAHAAVRTGRAIGHFVFSWIPIRRKFAIRQLGEIFPDIPLQRRKAIIRNTYANFGQTFIELMRAPQRDDAELDERVRIHNIDVLQEAKARGKGVIFLSGHFGNWEIMAAALRAVGFPMTVIARRQRNKLIDPLIDGYRYSEGIVTLPPGMAVRGILRTLRQNKAIALLADQDAKHRGIFVDFLGRPSSTATGPAIFALKTGASLIFTVCIIRHDATYDLYLQKLDYDKKDSEREIIQRYANLLGDRIRTWPDHWLWMHKRWKTKPESN